MVCPLYRDCPLLTLYYIDRGLKFGNLVLSIVERYLIQCPLGVSVKRDSTVNSKGYAKSPEFSPALGLIIFRKMLLQI